MMRLSDRIGNNEWCQSCLKRRVNKGYSQCLFCQRKIAKESIDYYKVGYGDGYVAAQIEMLTLGTNRADLIDDQRQLKVPKKSKIDYYFGFKEGQNKYQDDYSMDAAFGFDL
ncbi:hypothetical protein [Fructobacillus sp. EFB-N1]|uniref:hypothetical protein n=1 Tax=Fructobacillus sp. EFB-N1 TaxID=1658766 RepID=UPI00128BC1DA|nr:hypothetical protein [Fructobacillus sp. EFB-N1]